jgi:hypothetical protein
MVARKTHPPAARPAPGPFALRPMARCKLVSVFEREIREKLSRSAVDLLFSVADVLFEGQKATRGGREAFLGSAMVTIDLRKLVLTLREANDPRAAQRLGALLAKEPAATARARAIAEAELERTQGKKPRDLTAEVRVRSRGTTLFVDVDVEASF